jgi:hypothetical protein
VDVGTVFTRVNIYGLFTVDVGTEFTGINVGG